jgi:hypothetical protein
MTTINPNERLDDLHPSRFLKVIDLLERWKVREITVTISRFEREETTPNPKDVDPTTRKPRVVIQPVLYFKTKGGAEFPRGYLVSAGADIQSLKTATSSQTVGEVIGKKIRITVGEFKHKAVLRIDPNPVKE